MRHRPTGPTLAFVLLALAATCEGAKWASSKELALHYDYTPLTPEQLALTSVPFAPGAPAVVLLDAVQDGPHYLRHRRVKILTEGGVQAHGDYRLSLRGKWTILEVKARTVLPDGTIVDATDAVARDESKSRRGVQTIAVAFPRVQVGAILDFVLEAHHEGGRLRPWYPQERVPVLLSRLVIQQPMLKFQSAVRNLPPEAATPQTFPLLGGQAFAWTFRDVPPLPDLPFAPPEADIAQQLLFHVQAIRVGDYAEKAPSDWKDWARDDMRAWNEWMKKDHQKAGALAREAVAAEGSAIQKAEAIRRALSSRVHADTNETWTLQESPDDVLQNGGGTSADVAGLTTAMLRSVGVEARLAAYRRKDSGAVSLDQFLPALLDSYLVGVPDAAGVVTWFDPTEPAPVGRLPWLAAGVQVVPLHQSTTTPIRLPAQVPADHRIERVADVVVEPTGEIRGTVTVTHHRAAADRLRGELLDLTPEARMEELERRLRRWLPDARITSIESDDPGGTSSDTFVLRAAFASQAATRAGQRLILNPHLFTRVSTQDWGAETRDVPLWWDAPSEESSRITLRVPGTVTTITLPQSMRMDAAPVGLYVSQYSAAANVITIERDLRLDMHSFPAPAYQGLRRWFLDMAAADDQPVVLSLP